MADNVKEMFVVEWSAKQNAFQIRTVGEMLESNLRTALHGYEIEYVVVAIAGAFSEAKRIAEAIEAKLKVKLSNLPTHELDSID